MFLSREERNLSDALNEKEREWRSMKKPRGISAYQWSRKVERQLADIENARWELDNVRQGKRHRGLDDYALDADELECEPEPAKKVKPEPLEEPVAAPDEDEKVIEAPKKKAPKRRKAARGGRRRKAPAKKKTVKTEEKKEEEEEEENQPDAGDARTLIGLVLEAPDHVSSEEEAPAVKSPRALIEAVMAADFDLDDIFSP